jgi:hypothetical protein
MVKPDAKSGNFRPRRYAGCSVSLHAQAWQVAFKEHGYYIPYEQLRKQIGKGGHQSMSEKNKV